MNCDDAPFYVSLHYWINSTYLLTYGSMPINHKPSGIKLLVESIVEFEPKVPMETFPSFAYSSDTTFFDQLFVVAINKFKTSGIRLVRKWQEGRQKQVQSQNS